MNRKVQSEQRIHSASNEIKAVIFDYFGVISSDEYWNLVKTDKDVSSDFLDLANKVNLGSVHWKDFIQTIANKTGQTFSEVKAMYAAEQINPVIVALAKQLHSSYRTGIITNAHHEFLEPIIAKTHLHDVFDIIVISSRVGVIKPDARIFNIALKQLGVRPEETIFIDDIKSNVAGAESVGIHGIHYQNLNKLEEDLERMIAWTKK